MENQSGELFPRKWSSSFPTSLSLVWWEALLLLGSGALAVVLHQVLRMPLQLPGRHGIEWMALLVLSRSMSRFRWAGGLSGLGAAVCSLLPIWGALDDPLIWLFYLVPGIVMDLAFTALPHWREQIWFLAGLGGLAHATKPLGRWAINLATGLPYSSLWVGVGYPLATHLLFGVVGGLLGGLIAWGVRRVSSKG
jgi:hypothetical protein